MRINKKHESTGKVEQEKQIFFNAVVICIININVFTNLLFRYFIILMDIYAEHY
jgi:hypothetical protein